MLHVSLSGHIIMMFYSIGASICIEVSVCNVRFTVSYFKGLSYLSDINYVTF